MNKIYLYILLIGAVVLLIITAIDGFKNPFNLEKGAPLVIHDTVLVVGGLSGGSIPKPDTVKINNPTVDYQLIREVCINYYKMGWVDGSNNVIGLINNETADDKHVLILRKKAFKKIEDKVNSIK